MAQKQHWQKIEADKKALRALIRREYSASQMNNTKWRELAETLRDLRLIFTIKFVDVEGPLTGGGFWPTADGWWDGPFGPFLTISIEWLDIDPIRYISRHGRLLRPEGIDYTEEVAGRLQYIHIPYYKEDGKEGQSFRVVGHVRKGEGG